MDDGDTATRTEVTTNDRRRGRECDRCGRERPADPERLAVTVSDHADSTISYEKVLLCWQCWDHIKGELRRCVA